MAAGATSSLILLVSFDNQTLSILALLLNEEGKREAASVVSLAIIIVTVGMALIARHYGFKLGVSHHRKSQRRARGSTGMIRRCAMKGARVRQR